LSHERPFQLKLAKARPLHQQLRPSNFVPIN
jgi:hypothetical protein